MKLYWSCGNARGPSAQSINIDLSKVDVPKRKGGVGPDWESMKERGEKMAFGAEQRISPEVIGQGAYILNTRGTATLDGFLPPIKVTQPKSLGETKVEDGIDVTWEPVTGARGYILHAMGMIGQMQQIKEMIYWVSTRNEPPERVRYDYEQETTIADDLANGILLPPATTSCRVPAGIFKGVDSFNLTVTAVGNDYYSTADGITVRGKIRGKWMGMKMRGMAGFGVPPAGQEDDDNE